MSTLCTRHWVNVMVLAFTGFISLWCDGGGGEDGTRSNNNIELEKGQERTCFQHGGGSPERVFAGSDN